MQRSHQFNFLQLIIVKAKENENYNHKLSKGKECANQSGGLEHGPP